MNDLATWSCFGKLWEEAAIECTGGFDLAYRSHKSESNLRERCTAFEACRAAKQENRAHVFQPQVVPAQQLIRHPQPPPVPQQYAQQQRLHPPPPPPPPVAAYPAPGYVAPQPQYAQPQPQHYVQPQYFSQPQTPQYHHTHQGAHPYHAQFGPQHVPVAYQQPGAQMPAYLAVPEPVESGPWWVRLLAEIARSMAKASGHSIASFFDHNPMRLHRAPQPPPQVLQQPVQQAPQPQR